MKERKENMVGKSGSSTEERQRQGLDCESGSRVQELQALPATKIAVNVCKSSIARHLVESWICRYRWLPVGLDVGYGEKTKALFAS